ncbi:YxeA family protein [Staphylococcus aureus]|uniref:YxeA family protein n=1 Tax=Staphylococcus aureus TaxID=1280 RepID=UPI000AA6F7F8|nr:YxeA family protein [Staphylococcus aureus]
MKRTLIIVTSVLLIIILSLLLVRNEHLDRLTHWLKEKVSYAQSSKDTQDYRNITVYSKNGEKKSYKLDFLGYDPTKEICESKS